MRSNEGIHRSETTFYDCIMEQSPRVAYDESGKAFRTVEVKVYKKNREKNLLT